MARLSISLNSILLSRSDCSRCDGDLSDNRAKLDVARLRGLVRTGATLASVVRRERTRSRLHGSLILRGLGRGTQGHWDQLPYLTWFGALRLELYLTRRGFRCCPVLTCPMTVNIPAYDPDRSRNP